jgi:hypothetical protein
MIGRLILYRRVVGDPTHRLFVGVAARLGLPIERKIPHRFNLEDIREENRTPFFSERNFESSRFHGV